MSEHHQHDQGAAIPAELWPVHQRLLDDGGIWREEFPPSASFRRGVEAFARSQATQAATAVDGSQDRERSGVSKREVMSIAPPPAQSSANNPVNRKVSRRLGGLVAVAAMLTIAALFGVVLRQLPTNGPAQRHPATATPAPAAGVWRNVGQFQAHDGERVAVAPSDPYVVYRLNSANFTMERSDDGGATWRAVTFPPEISQSLRSNPVFAINPLSANTVYLTTFGDPSKMVCMSPIPPGGKLPASKCSEQYVSTDGGKNWQQLVLPDNGQLTGMLSQVFGAPKAPLLPQGSRVYSLMTLMAPMTDSYRLVVSADGVHWQTADRALVATGQRIESYLSSPMGSTVWATLADSSLWRSDNAGENWVRVASMPQAQFPATRGIAAARTVDSKSFLYTATYSPPLGDIAPADVRVSSDGGKTWRQAPAAGVPNGQRAAPSAVMMRGDGSIVLLFRTPQVNIAFDEGILHDAAYYAWTPGADSWTRLTPTFDALAVEQTWITPANDAKPLETIWALIYRDDNLTYDRDAYIKDGVYSISEVGLAP